MEAAVELGATAIDHLTDKHGDTVLDYVNRKRGKSTPQNAQDNDDDDDDDRPDPNPAAYPNTAAQARADRQPDHRPRRFRQQLPSPEPDPELEAQSETSERVLRAYENEPDDPKRRPSPSIYPAASTSSRRRPPRDARDDRYRNNDRYRPETMSHANGYAPSQRPSSQQPPPRRGRNYDDDPDDDNSDYDERSGRRYRQTGRGYDPDRDRDFDREIVETERYRGPPREWASQRSPSHNEQPNMTGATGAIAPYHRSANDLAAYDQKRRSRSRGRRDDHRHRDYDDRDDDDDDDRDRSHDGIRGKIDEAFDTSIQGLGVGLAGAVVGGLAARQFGDKRHSKRDMVIGALIGGLGANAAENKFRDWQEERKEKTEHLEDRWEQRYDGGGGKDYRSRSALR